MVAIAVGVLMLVSSLVAQPTTQPVGKAAAEAEAKQEARTRYEKFAATDGVLKIKETYTLSAPKSKYGTAEAMLVKVTNVQSGESVIALLIEYKGTEKYDRQHASILDEDEVASLASALAYIKSNRVRLVKDAKTYTEVTYSSRGGLRTGFYIEGPKTGDYLEVGGETVFLESLDELAQTISEAQRKIAEIKK